MDVFERYLKRIVSNKRKDSFYSFIYQSIIGECNDLPVTSRFDYPYVLLCRIAIQRYNADFRKVKIAARVVTGCNEYNQITLVLRNKT